LLCVTMDTILHLWRVQGNRASIQRKVRSTTLSITPRNPPIGKLAVRLPQKIKAAVER
jgi:hypothetical protein